MTIDEFLIELAMASKGSHWKRFRKTVLRCEDEGLYSCPLTFLSFRKDRVRLEVYQTLVAAKKLGLSNEDRLAIQLAADGDRKEGFEKPLRRRLIWAVRGWRDKG